MLFTFLQPPGKITTLTLSKSWLKLLGEGHSTEPDKRAVMILPVRNLLKCEMQISQTQIIQEWTEVDSNDPGHQLYTDEEIISEIREIVLRRRG